MYDKQKRPTYILENLEKKFYVSSKNKSLFDYLVTGPKWRIKRDFPLRKRILLKYSKVK